MRAGRRFRRSRKTSRARSTSPIFWSAISTRSSFGVSASIGFLNCATITLAITDESCSWRSSNLVLGLDPTELGGAPFGLTVDAAYEARARELGLDVAPGAFVYALPCIAGHVGADTAGVVLAEGPHLKDELTLLVDVGANARSCSAIVEQARGSRF
jgi:hypothetical protein